MDENDPIYRAIDRGGGQVCDVPGIIRELQRAGFVIAPIEPTEEMIEKGMWSRSETGRYGPRDVAITIYQAMVGAARRT